MLDTTVQTPEKRSPVSYFDQQLNQKRQVRLKTCADVYDYWRNCKRLYKKAPKDGVEFQVDYIDTGLALSEELRDSAPIALALHGAPGSYHDFALLIHHLSQQNVRVIAPNFPEYTATVKTKVLFRHSADEKAAYLRDFLRSINVNKIDLLVSHSSAIFPTLLILLNANNEAIAKQRQQQADAAGHNNNKSGAKSTTTANDCIELQALTTTTTATTPATTTITDHDADAGADDAEDEAGDDDDDDSALPSAAGSTNDEESDVEEAEKGQRGRICGRAGADADADTDDMTKQVAAAAAAAVAAKGVADATHEKNAAAAAAADKSFNNNSDGKHCDESKRVGGKKMTTTKKKAERRSRRQRAQDAIVKFDQPIEIKAVALFNPAGHRLPKSMKPTWFKCGSVRIYQHKLGRSLFRKLGPAFLTVVGVPVRVDNMDNVMLSATVMRNSKCHRVIQQLEQLSRLKMPTLLVFSENDKLIEKEIFYEMTQFMRLDQKNFDVFNNDGDIELSQSLTDDWIRVMVFKAGGHYAYSNYAKTVNKAVSELLQKVVDKPLGEATTPIASY